MRILSANVSCGKYNFSYNKVILAFKNAFFISTFKGPYKLSARPTRQTLLHFGFDSRKVKTWDVHTLLVRAKSMVREKYANSVNSAEEHPYDIIGSSFPVNRKENCVSLTNYVSTKILVGTETVFGR